MRREKEEIRQGKKKRTETEEPKDQAPIVVSEEEPATKRRGGGGGYEAYSEQPVLTPTADQGTPTQTRAEEIGKQRAANEETSTSKLPVSLNEMKERDEKLR